MKKKIYKEVGVLIKLRGIIQFLEILVQVFFFVLLL